MLRSALGLSCGLGLLRYTGYPGVPFVLSASFCIICTLCTVSGISDNLVDVLHLRNLHGVHHFGILYLLHHWHKSLRIDKDIFHSCCSSTVSARLECCELGFASHLIDLLLDDRNLSLRGVIDNLGMFHLHCVDVVLGVHVHNLFHGSLLDPVLRYTDFGWSLRVRGLLRDFGNSDDLLLLSTESEESRPVWSPDWSLLDWSSSGSTFSPCIDFLMIFERLHLNCVHDLLDMRVRNVLRGFENPWCSASCQCHDLFQDSFRNTFLWNGVNNFHDLCLFWELKSFWYVFASVTVSSLMALSFGPWQGHENRLKLHLRYLDNLRGWADWQLRSLNSRPLLRHKCCHKFHTARARMNYPYSCHHKNMTTPHRKPKNSSPAFLHEREFCRVADFTGHSVQQWRHLWLFLCQRKYTSRGTIRCRLAARAIQPVKIECKKWVLHTRVQLRRVVFGPVCTKSMIKWTCTRSSGNLCCCWDSQTPANVAQVLKRKWSSPHAANTNPPL